MKKSEVIEMLQDNIVISLKQRECINENMFPEKYGYCDGKIFAFKLIRDALFYMHVDDDMQVLPLYENSNLWKWG